MPKKVSSLGLQMALYYHNLFSLLYFPLTAALLYIKHQYLIHPSVLHQVDAPLCFIVALLTEITRSLMGFSGNLKQKVPQMTGFLFLTIFPQSLIFVYISFFEEFTQYIDRVLGILTLVFLVIEFYFGYQTLCKLIKRQTVTFIQLQSNDSKV